MKISFKKVEITQSLIFNRKTDRIQEHLQKLSSTIEACLKVNSFLEKIQIKIEFTRKKISSYLLVTLKKRNRSTLEELKEKVLMKKTEENQVVIVMKLIDACPNRRHLQRSLLIILHIQSHYLGW
jgi:hypothetical protein